MQYKEYSYIPALAHNSSGYDSHSILLKIAEKFKEYDFLCVAENIGLIFFAPRQSFEKKFKKVHTKIIH